MPVTSPVRRPARFIALVAAVALAGTVAGACSSSASAPPSFDASAPCTVDAKLPGAYPALEALIPARVGDTAHVSLDSGRNCTATNLGTLADHGVKEVQFAGGVWQDSAEGAITLAVFSAPGLQPDWMGEWYEATARSARVTGSIQTTRPTIDGQQAYRMDLVNGEAPQVAITWPGPTPDTVRVVLASDESEDRIQAAIAAFGGK
jgi:hypothetical protein